MKVTEKIHILTIDFEIPIAPGKVMPRFVNIIIVLGERITLVDTGVKNSYSKIYDYIIENGRKISEIDTIILSHSHPDHIGSAMKIRNDTGCKVLAHKAEQDWIENIDKQFAERPVPGFYTLVDQPVQLDGFLEHNQELTLGEKTTVRVFHSPGHSRGSINLFFENEKVLFTADSVALANDIPNYENYQELRNSLNFIKDFERYDIFLSSWTQPLFNRDETLKLIASGEQYLDKLDVAVKKHYAGKSDPNPDCCKNVIMNLNLPPVFVNPIVDKAFRSHF